MKIIHHCSAKFGRMQPKLEFLPPLITRLVIGWVFIESGWGKLTHLDKVIEFFGSLGIPFASVQAPFVAGLELVAGLLVLLGLATRFASVPLIGVMIVAIITAKSGDIEGIGSLFGLSEFLYIVLLVWLVVRGAGRVSLDQVVQNKCGCSIEKGN